MKEYAVRNIRLCTKDCLCLYVCPTGATDTEDSIIDREKCIGCGACARACPGGAISLVPARMPPQQPKTEGVTAAMRRLALNKAKEENLARTIYNKNGSPLMAAVARSCRLTAEDIYREAGYMLPQSANALALLKEIALSSYKYAAEIAKQLMSLLPLN